MPPTYRLTRWLFLRLLGGVALVAFVSLAVQLRGLVGSRGILPAAEFLQRAREALGGRAIFELPTLLWWWSSDAAMLLVAASGIVASLLLVAGWLEGPAAVVAWICYLSLTVAGQTFLSFQWDALLLESLLCAAFWASWRWRSRPGDAESVAGRWLVWMLVFKLMFLSGATKLLSGDPTWRDLSALTFHYQTQPLPSWISWWMHRLPVAVQRASVVGMLFVELVLPLLLLSPWRAGWARRIAAVGFGGLQLVIAWTGNYGFFNVLALLLSLALIDDSVWRAGWRHLSRRAAADAPAEISTSRLPWAVALAAGAVAGLSLVSLAAEMQRTAGRALPAWERATLEVVSPWRSINGYGLFRVMTTERPELIVEISDDGDSWREVVFRFKPGPLARRPPVVPFYMPRLDWQMWFAALDPGRAEGWLAPFLERLLQDEPAVWSLLGEPRPATPPRGVRLLRCRYRFSTAEERRVSGRWWARDEPTRITQDLELDAAGILRVRR